jgi:hypothetical protein
MPLIVAIALLLPVAYVGSYFALVIPRGRVISYNDGRWNIPVILHYRALPAQAAVLYWPLERIDRKLRPKTWEPYWPGMQLDVF